MPTIQADISPRDLLKAVEQLSLPDLDQFVSEVLDLRAKRVAPFIPAAEASKDCKQGGNSDAATQEVMSPTSTRKVPPSAIRALRGKYADLGVPTDEFMREKQRDAMLGY